MILTVTANASIDKRAVVTDFKDGEVNRIKECVYSAGGKGLNVSRAAHIAGEEILATGFLGGHAGKYIEESLVKEGIGADFVWCEGESRSCMNIWNETTREQTEFLEPGLTCRPEDEEALVEKITELLSQASVMTISGSCPKGSGAGLYHKLLKAGAEKGKKVLLDTSGKLLTDSLAGEEKPFLIKPNMDEIRMISGREINSVEDIEDAAKVLHEQGVKYVVISMGGDGSVMSGEDGLYRAVVPKIDAVNTVGCGDSMIGGFAVGISRGLTMPECLKLASAISAAAAMTDRTGFFRMEDMEKIKDQIRIEKI
ncbi:MAG: 1-phosphofructokinase family hexose kinase [Eubacterium sp.]|nr:1-phosphofructokinase family hexose kinase [Eubacterium sp.]